MAAPGPSHGRSRSPHRQGVDRSGLHPGCKVRLHGLKGAAELNGQCGILDMFINSSGRWRVKLSSGQSKDIKPDNIEQLATATQEKTSTDESLHPGCKVKLRGLKSAVELNGQEGILEAFVDFTGRWRIKMENGQIKDLKPENLEAIEPELMFSEPELPESGLHPGCKVGVHGLKGAAELNGQEGIIESFITMTMRWRVKLSSGQCKDLKQENLLVLEPEVMVTTAEALGTCLKKGQDQEEKSNRVSPDVSKGISLSGVSMKQDQEQRQESSHEEQKTESSVIDSPGMYIITGAGATVNDGPSLNARKLTLIDAGTRVEVVEVVNSTEFKRIRARIVQPPGWISLLNTQDGHRFANRVDHRLSTKAPKAKYKDEEAIALKPGEVCGPNGRFVILNLLGEGAYSTVWRCKDSLSQTEYALKFTRSTEKTRSALMREMKIMGHLSAKLKSDVEGSQYLLTLAFPEGFEHKSHMCVLFEPMRYNVLTALARHGQDKGLPLLPTVRNFGKNLFLALRVLRQANLIHSDVKPENLLVSKDGESVKLSDFGCAVTVSESEGIVNDLMMPRWYRAPEVMLGQPWGPPIDMWSAGATLYQMATDRFLFSGDDNNAMLKEMLAICGAFPTTMVTSGQCASKHFDAAGDFLLHPTMQKVLMSSFSPPARPITQTLKTLLVEPPKDVPPDRHEYLVEYFSGMLCGCLSPDPSSRASPQDALNHRFFGKRAGDPFADLSALWAEHDKKQKQKP